MGDNISTLIGRLHPALVHLPIGILILAFILQWIFRKEKNSNYQRAVDISLLVGVISAILSCITGYILSRSGDYDEQAVSLHQWMGISTAVISILLYYLRRRGKAIRWQWPLMTVLLIIVFVTGHLGGSLTHGADYLTQAFGEGSSSGQELQRKPIPNVQEALAFQDIVQPVLQSRCYGCHNAKKKKGSLQMDQQDLLMKGGKHGVVIKPGNADSSELVKRLLLPREDEYHMPPKEKPQPAEHDIALVRWWIATGAPFNKKVKELEQPESVKILLLALQKAPELKSLPEIPETPVEKADEAAIKKLQDKGVVILPVAQNSNYLQANFVMTGHASDSILQLLLPLKKQLVWLKLSNTDVGNSGLAIVGQCSNLMRLHLDHTPITNEGLDALKGLTELRYLNLVSTKITLQGVMKLTALKKLRSLYLYQTNVTEADWANLQKAFPKTQIDSGGYEVPTFITDTTEVKYIAPKK